MKNNLEKKENGTNTNLSIINQVIKELVYLCSFTGWSVSKALPHGTLTQNTFSNLRIGQWKSCRFWLLKVQLTYTEVFRCYHCTIATSIINVIFIKHPNIFKYKKYSLHYSYFLSSKINFNVILCFKKTDEKCNYSNIVRIYILLN